MDSWSKEHLGIMKVGGNRSCQRYLECYGVKPDEDIKLKYSSEAAESYKKVLQKKATRLDETESSTEASIGSPVATRKPPARMEASSTLDESSTSFANDSSAGDVQQTRSSSAELSAGVEDATARNSQSSALYSGLVVRFAQAPCTTAPQLQRVHGLGSPRQ